MENNQVSPLKNIYLERYAYPETHINLLPAENLELIVTIPCYNEPSPILSLQSLQDADLPHNICIEIIIVINQSDQTPRAVKQQNELTYSEILTWVKKNATHQRNYHVIYKRDLPHKHAGVGLARKIAMDEAVRRFESINNPNGIIVCFDADSQCDTNYLQAIHTFFSKNPKCPGASIYFEHPLEGHNDAVIYEAITDYELFLRYYIGALRYAGFPYAYETIGSSMAVRSSAYQKQGGMNRRKAGEDFYFLHKIIPLDNFGEINETRVIPSPRKSDRVPFGTGKAVSNWMMSHELKTYHVQTFTDLKYFLSDIIKLFKIDNSKLEVITRSWPETIKLFLNSKDFKANLHRINSNSATIPSFYKHFFQWFDGFMALKFVHFSRDNFYANKEVGKVATELLVLRHEKNIPVDKKALLKKYRQMERQGWEFESSF